MFCLAVLFGGESPRILIFPIHSPLINVEFMNSFNFLKRRFNVPDKTGRRSSFRLIFPGQINFLLVCLLLEHWTSMQIISCPIRISFRVNLRAVTASDQFTIVFPVHITFQTSLGSVPFTLHRIFRTLMTQSWIELFVTNKTPGILCACQMVKEFLRMFCSSKMILNYIINQVN